MEGEGGDLGGVGGGGGLVEEEVQREGGRLGRLFCSGVEEGD